MTALLRRAATVFLVLLLAGCSTIDRLTGQTDNTVLPGQREDAIPGKKQFPEEGASQPATASTSAGDQLAAPQPEEAAPEPQCDASDPACQASSQDIYSDPQ